MKNSLSIVSYLHILYRISRLNVSLAVSFSAMTGFILRNRRITLPAAIVFAGVFLLSACASGLNQLQEVRQDGIMMRTRGRPLPSGTATPGAAWLLCILSGLSGLYLLYRLTTPAAAVLGFINIILYNGIYTPLKRKTRYSIFIGAVTGAVPAVIGWLAAGAFSGTPEILFLFLFMYIWQIPHFMLLLFVYGKEYEKASFPSYLSGKSGKKALKIIYSWVLAAAGSTVLFLFSYVISSKLYEAVLITAGICLSVYFYRLFFVMKESIISGRSSRILYYYQALVLIIIAAGSLKMYPF